MFKPASIQRVQAALGLATQVVMAQPNANGSQGSEQMSEDGKMQLMASIAALILEEDDRQARTVIIPGRGA